MKRHLPAIILLGAFVATLAVWLPTSAPFVLSGDPAKVMIAFGRLAGLLLQLALLAQLILIGRVAWIERLFGHDKMNRVHRVLGYSLASLLVLHPLLLSLGYASFARVGPLTQFLNFLTQWEDVALAAVGAAILTAVVLIAVPPVRRRLPYEWWYASHLFVYVALISVFAHQLNGADVSTGRGTHIWVALNLAVALLYASYRFGRPIYRYWRHRFRVERVVEEAPNVHSVYIAGRDMASFRFEPGQFANWYFFQKDFIFSHPFSFSAAPDGERLRITVKSVGNFTRKVRELRPGTPVVVDGPLGTFTAAAAETGKYLFIAGGIGITPIRSMLEGLSRNGGADATLIYGVRTVSDAALRFELERFAPRTHLVLSDEKREGYESGRVGAALVERLVPDFRDRDAYLCGPVPMMESMATQLVAAGVPRSRVHYEKFSY